MLVVALAGVILAIGVPNLRQFMLNNRMTGAANDLLAAVYMARTESIKRHSQAVVCFTSDATAATPACDGDGRQGWIVFVDDADPNAAHANDNNGQADLGEEILIRHGPLPGGVTVRSFPPANEGYVAYSPAGFSREIGAVGADLDALVLCDERGNSASYGPNNSTARGFILSPTGRPGVTRVVSRITELGGCG